MNEKKRIRDILFPEGSKLRNFLRLLNKIIKNLNAQNIKKFLKLAKQKGFIKALKDTKNILSGRVEVDRKTTYQKWIEENEPTEAELEEQRNTKFKVNPKISILVPLFNTPVNFFDELVQSLIDQTYKNWELCLADGSETQNPELMKIVEKDSRIKYKFMNENKNMLEIQTNV